MNGRFATAAAATTRREPSARPAAGPLGPAIGAARVTRPDRTVLRRAMSPSSPGGIASFGLIPARIRGRSAVVTTVFAGAAATGPGGYVLLCLLGAGSFVGLFSVRRSNG
ncbi:hypothetical protein FAGKG844_120022 [Frankia sp. AgKG'84/4]